MDNVGKSQHAYLRTYGRRFSTCAMTEDTQLKEHNLRKFDTCVHIEQLVDATYHSNLASATPESEEIFEAGNVPHQPDKLSTVSNLRLVSFEEMTGGKPGIPIDAEPIPVIITNRSVNSKFRFSIKDISTGNVLLDQETFDSMTMYLYCSMPSLQRIESLNAQGVLLPTNARARRLAANLPFDFWKETVDANTYGHYNTHRLDEVENLNSLTD